MKTLIKGGPDWHNDVNENFEEVTTQLSDLTNNKANKTDLIICEEGTWIPKIAGNVIAGSNSYAAQVGTYAKIGKSVTINFQIDVTLGTTIGGEIYIINLPFVAKNIAIGNIGICSIVNNGSITQFSILTVANYNSLVLRKINVNGTYNNIKNTDLGTTLNIVGSITYQI